MTVRISFSHPLQISLNSGGTGVIWGTSLEYSHGLMQLIQRIFQREGYEALEMV